MVRAHLEGSSGCGDIRSYFAGHGPVCGAGSTLSTTLAAWISRSSQSVLMVMIFRQTKGKLMGDSLSLCLISLLRLPLNLGNVEVKCVLCEASDFNPLRRS